MAAKNVALELAAFLDSSAARSLSAGAGKDARGIVEAWLEACYEDLGKAPRLLDGEDVRALLGSLLPSRMKRRDPRAAHVPEIVTAYLDHLEATQVVTQAFEIRQALDEALDAFASAVATGANVPERAPKQPDPFVHRASKLGRNDPCSCGSGKKYKKCHGKNA